MKYLMPVSFLLASALGASACDALGGSCTDADCDSQFRLVLSTPGQLRAGTYDVTVGAPDAPVTFVCTVTAEGLTSRCDGPERAGVSILLDPISGSSVRAFNVVVDGKQAQVLLDVDLDGEPLLTRTFTPSYQTTRPNGPDCGPVCYQAGDQVEL